MSDAIAAVVVTHDSAGEVDEIVAALADAMSAQDEAAADLWSTGLSTRWSAAEFARPYLDGLGAVPAAALDGLPDGSRVVVGGVVTHRQRPSTAGGTIFMNLEDETGMVNIICSPGAWVRFRRVARLSPALVVTGRLECQEGALAVVVQRLDPLPLELSTGGSRDFR